MTARSALFPLLVCSALLAGCSSQSSAQEPAKDPTLVREASGYLATDGLFRAPDAGTATRPLLIDTAAFVPALGGSNDPIDWRRAATNPLPTRAGLGEAQAYLSVAKAAGVRLTAAQLAAASRAVTEPGIEQDAGSEIGALWTWSHAVQLLGTQAVAGAKAKIIARLGAIDAATLADSPYLLLRLDQAYRQIGSAPPAAVQTARAATCSRPLPEPTDLKQILDSIPIAACTRGPGAAAARTSASTARLATIADESLTRGEDFSAAAALQVLAASGSLKAIRPSTTTALRQRTKATGLLSALPAANGTVHATYSFARLLDTDFARVATKDTRNRLAELAQDASAPLVTRLEAAVALRRSGDKRWKESAALAEHAWTGGSRIGATELAPYLAVMDPASQLTDSLPKAQLTDFDPGDDQTLQRASTAAIALSYLFSNDTQVHRMFASTQARLVTWASPKNPQVAQRVIAAAALPNAALSGADSTVMEAAGRSVSALRGCAGSVRLIRSAQGVESTCSLDLSVLATAVPGVA